MDQDKKLTHREQQAIETRSKILKAALERFSTQGFHGTSVRDINKSIDVADGLLYHYFPGGKEELFKIINQEAIAQLEEEIKLKRLSYEKMSIDDVLESIYQHASEIFEIHFHEIKLLILEYWKSNDGKKSEINTIINKTELWFPQMLAERAKKGEIKEIDYESATYAVISIFMHHFMSRIIGMEKGYLNDPSKRHKLFKLITTSWKEKED